MRKSFSPASQKATRSATIRRRAAKSSWRKRAWRVFSGLTEDLSGPVMSAFVDKLGANESRRLEELAKLIESKRKKRKRGK